MPDIYLYDDVPVLKNLLDIKDADLLDIAEAGMSRANMMLLYESGFQDFSPAGLREIHRRLFFDIYCDGVAGPILRIRTSGEDPVGRDLLRAYFLYRTCCFFGARGHLQSRKVRTVSKRAP